MRYLGIKDQFIIGDSTVAHTMKFEDHIKDLTGAQHNLSQYDSHRSEINLNIHNKNNNNNLQQHHNQNNIAH